MNSPPTSPITGIAIAITNDAAAMDMVSTRWRSAQRMTPRYHWPSAPNEALKRLSSLPTGPLGSAPSACGSYQRDDSIGSSVNDTNSDTVTAKATTMPNWKKNRPTMPPMNATGTNTARIDSVVAMTA